jgi:hypothetical protein
LGGILLAQDLHDGSDRGFLPAVAGGPAREQYPLPYAVFLQYSYFLQLISDANGILVFLKFLTDKFASLETVRAGSPFSREGEGRG